MFELCEQADQCGKVNCNYTKGAFCGSCEEICRNMNTTCNKNIFVKENTIEDKTEKLIELSKTKLGHTIFYPLNQVTSFEFSDV
jgi:hypothetical protein